MEKCQRNCCENDELTLLVPRRSHSGLKGRTVFVWIASRHWWTVVRSWNTWFIPEAITMIYLARYARCSITTQDHIIITATCYWRRLLCWLKFVCCDGTTVVTIIMVSLWMEGTRCLPGANWTSTAADIKCHSQRTKRIE